MSGGNFNFREVETLYRQLEKIQKERDKFYQNCAKELAARLISKVKKRTPVDHGNLRRNWTIGEVEKNGDIYIVEVINPTEYSSYVEYGHRTANHTGWIPGRFMMTISEHEIEHMIPGFLEKKIEQYLRGC